MAERSKRRCRVPGCGSLTRSASGYCETHEHGHRKEKGDNKRADHIYLSREWRRLRLWKLSQSPVCELCQGVRVATIVHHRVAIKDGGDPYAVENLVSLCPECHNRIHGGGNISRAVRSVNRIGRIGADARRKKGLGPGGSDENPEIVVLSKRFGRAWKEIVAVSGSKVGGGRIPG